MKAFFFYLLLVPALALSENLEQKQKRWTVGKTVQTTSGPVQGHAASNATQVSEYLGILFAIPPVRDLRFTAPQPYSGKSTINGSSYVSGCPT